MSPPAMLVARRTGALPAASFSTTQTLPVGDAGDDRRQPFLDPPTLYYARNLSIASVEQLATDPALATSWSSPRALLVGEPGSARVGAVVALGQPTIAHLADGSVELFFVYGIKTATGIDMQAGRVRRR